jgi:hypothetical protein
LTAIDDLKSRNFFRRTAAVASLQDRRPGYIPPVSLIQDKLDHERQRQDQAEWIIEDLKREQAEKEAEAAKEAAKSGQRSDLPTVAAPKIERP